MTTDRITFTLRADFSEWVASLAWASRSLVTIAREVEDITQRIERMFGDPGPALDQINDLASTTRLSWRESAERTIRDLTTMAIETAPKRAPSGLHVTRAQIDNALRKANR